MSAADAYALAALAIGFAGGWGWSALWHAYRARRAARERDTVQAAIVASLSRDPRALAGTIRVGTGPARRVPLAIVCDNASPWRD